MAEWILVVAILVNGMAGPNFHEREKCQKALIELNNEYDLNPFILPYTQSNNPEIVMRCNVVIAYYNNPYPTVPLLCLDYPKITSYDGLNDKDWEKCFKDIFFTEPDFSAGIDKESACYKPKWADIAETDERNATSKLVKQWQKNNINRKEIIRRLNLMVFYETYGITFKPKVPEDQYYGLIPQAMPLLKNGLFIRFNKNFLNILE